LGKSSGRTAISAVAIIVFIGIVVLAGFGSYFALASRTGAHPNVSTSSSETSSSFSASTSPSTISSTNTATVYRGFSNSTQTRNSSLGLELDMTLNSTQINQNGSVLVSIASYNILNDQNNVTPAFNWATKGLTLPGCGINRDQLPIGLGVIKGYFIASNISQAYQKDYILNFTKPPYSPYCGINIYASDLKYDLFNSNSDIFYPIPYQNCPPSPCAAIPPITANVTVSVSGNWTFTTVPMPVPLLNSFTPGVYTIVGGDEWGDLAMLHFAVS
jgi:hypothetical protein